jgi:hypothetical protein
MVTEMTLKDKYYLLRNQSKIGKECIEKGYAIVKMPSGKIYKIRELG